MVLPRSLARAYRLDLIESEFALHIDSLLPLRFVATGERLGDVKKVMTSVN